MIGATRLQDVTASGSPADPVEAESVTANDSGQVASTVTHNACLDCQEYERTGPPENKRLCLGRLHCTTCHVNWHIACFVCSTCLPDRHRYDRRYCSSTCRVTAHKRREEARLERAVWEEENPEEARRQLEEYEAKIASFRAALAGSGMAGNPEHRKREGELKDQAERCAKEIWHSDTKTFSNCDRRFEPGDVIYRQRALLTDPVLPYCREHRCDQRDGYHNRDAPEGKYYPTCYCDDRHWDEPQPCPGCARLVSNPKNAPWRRVRQWLYSGEKEKAKPRPFCSDHCRRLVFRAARKAARQAESAGESRCVGCSNDFKGRRCDAKYCSVACRQRAYRQRPSSTEAAA